MEIGTDRFCNFFTQLKKQKVDVGQPKILDNTKVTPSVSIKQSVKIKDEYISSVSTESPMKVLSSMPESERYKKHIDSVTFTMLESLGINESDWISCNFAVGASGLFEVDTLSIQFREGYQGPDMETIVAAFNQLTINEKPFSQMVAEGDKLLTMVFPDMPNPAYTGQSAKH